MAELKKNIKRVYSVCVRVAKKVSTELILVNFGMKKETRIKDTSF